MLDTITLAKNAARELIESKGFTMADVSYGREDGQMCLTFYIRRKEGVNIEDCENISRLIEDAVDNAEPTGGKPYCLCVSSWGDRVLTNDDDLEFFKETECEIKVKKAEAKKKKFVGVLKDFDEHTITLLIKEENVIFQRDNIEFIRPYIGF